MSGPQATADTADTLDVGVLFAEHGDRVLAFAHRMLGNRADAEDAVQDVFLDLWTHGLRYDPDRGSPELFVAVIARRRLIDRRRRAQRRPVTEPMEGGEVLVVGGHDGGVETAVEAALAARAMDELRPEQREVLRLAVAEGLTHEEIAGRTGMPLGTVKAHARRGLLRIRKRLLGESVDDGVEEDTR